MTRRMPSRPRLSFFYLVKPTRDPAFISSPFYPLLHPELVTAMDRADSSRLAAAFPEYFLAVVSLLFQRSTLVYRSDRPSASDRCFLLCRVATNSQQINLLIERRPSIRSRCRTFEIRMKTIARLSRKKIELEQMRN